MEQPRNAFIIVYSLIDLSYVCGRSRRILAEFVSITLFIYVKILLLLLCYIFYILSFIPCESGTIYIQLLESNRTWLSNNQENIHDHSRHSHQRWIRTALFFLWSNVKHISYLSLQLLPFVPTFNFQLSFMHLTLQVPIWEFSFTWKISPTFGSWDNCTHGCFSWV